MAGHFQPVPVHKSIQVQIPPFREIIKSILDAHPQGEVETRKIICSGGIHVEPVPCSQFLPPVQGKNDSASTGQAKVIQYIPGSPQSQQCATVLQAIVYKALLQLAVQIQL